MSVDLMLWALADAVLEAERLDCSTMLGLAHARMTSSQLKSELRAARHKADVRLGAWRMTWWM